MKKKIRNEQKSFVHCSVGGGQLFKMLKIESVPAWATAHWNMIAHGTIRIHSALSNARVFTISISAAQMARTFDMIQTFASNASCYWIASIARRTTTNGSAYVATLCIDSARVRITWLSFVVGNLLGFGLDLSLSLSWSFSFKKSFKSKMF